MGVTALALAQQAAARVLLPTLVQRARVPAEAPQAEQSAQLLEHGLQASRRPLVLDQHMEPLEAGVLNEGHG